MHTTVIVFAPMALYERDPIGEGYIDWVNYWGWEPRVVNMRSKNEIHYYTKYTITVECLLT